MRALIKDGFDDDARVREVAMPEPGPGDVLIRVDAGSINPIDVAAAAGELRGLFEHAFPITLGRDFAGVVEAAGPAVEHLLPGDDVFGFVELADPVLAAGSFAEYIIVAQDAAIARRPAGLPIQQAAVLPLAGTAAVMAVDAIDPQPGDPVLITGATGGVGHNAVQLAAARGADVIATGLPGDAAALLGLGAASVIDYTGDVPAAVRERHPDGIAGLVYLAPPTADFAPQAELVAAGGRVVTTVYAADVQALAARGLRATNLNVAGASADVIERLAQLALSGALTSAVERTYTLDEIPDAFQHFARRRTRGKLAVAVRA